MRTEYFAGYVTHAMQKEASVEMGSVKSRPEQGRERGVYMGTFKASPKMEQPYSFPTTKTAPENEDCTKALSMGRLNKQAMLDGYVVGALTKEAGDPRKALKLASKAAKRAENFKNFSGHQPVLDQVVFPRTLPLGDLPSQGEQTKNILTDLVGRLAESGGQAVSAGAGKIRTAVEPAASSVKSNVHRAVDTVGKSVRTAVKAVGTKLDDIASRRTASAKAVEEAQQQVQKLEAANEAAGGTNTVLRRLLDKARKQMQTASAEHRLNMADAKTASDVRASNNLYSGLAAGTGIGGLGVYGLTRDGSKKNSQQALPYTEEFAVG